MVALSFVTDEAQEGHNFQTFEYYDRTLNFSDDFRLQFVDVDPVSNKCHFSSSVTKIVSFKIHLHSSLVASRG